MMVLHNLDLDLCVNRLQSSPQGGDSRVFPCSNTSAVDGTEEPEMSACFRTRAKQTITPLMVIKTMAEYGFCDYTLNAAAKVQY